VREKRALELAAHNDELALRGEQPVSHLPPKAKVSYGEVDPRRVDENMRLRLLAEKAERVAKTSGLHGTALMELGAEYWGVGTEGSEDAVSSSSAADDVCSSDEGASGLGHASQVPAPTAVEAASAPPLEPHSDLGAVEPLAHRASSANEAVVVATGSSTKPVAAEPGHEGNGATSAASEAADAARLVADSLRLFTEREQRRAAAVAQAAAGASDATSVSAAKEAPLPTQTPAAAALEPPRPVSSGACEWSPSMDAALVQLCGQAAFDFDKVAKALRTASEFDGTELCRRPLART
jgi:hypothetical protein